MQVKNPPRRKVRRKVKIMLNKNWLWSCLFVVLFTLIGLGSAQAHDEMEIGKYFTLVDENLSVIDLTARQVQVGDEYISADNSRYQVVKIEGETAYCVFKETETMPQVSFDEQDGSWKLSAGVVPVAGEKTPTVAIYHTHSDESYVPSDGKESVEGNGGIYDVGKVLADKLKGMGINVLYDENNHNPHDPNAYNRSRKTAATLLRKGPDMLLDVHRDAVPPQQYEADVNGEKVTKIKLVVGKQNPNHQTNLEFAKQIKAVMDQKTPGLSNGIFIGKGDFNQDLAPRSMLIEVGAHTNSKEEAEEGVKLFAESLPAILGMSSGSAAAQPAAPAAGTNHSANKTILIILVITAVAVCAYFLINKGSLQK